ncbi:MAG: outer membrane protein assembly factor BamD [Bacteroidia bacterium]|nr:outer membrane protein assembly factor BamD [Bacteroidia bacterium]MDW8089025.1 outer membrane protein assembly factor BamD [Bacteroidia bacterium]
MGRWMGWGSLLLLLAGCDPYRKLAKSRHLADRDSAAFGYFRRKQYESATPLFEELVGLYRGSARAAEVLYHLAWARFYVRDYYAAERYFGQLAEEYPLSPRAEEALFLQAKMNYLLSADYDFDQKETRKAIDRLQVYLTLYPEGRYSAEAERLLREMERKLELKAFHTAEVFYRIGRYRAAVVLYGDYLRQGSLPELREEAAYKRAAAALQMAEQSVQEKQLPRFAEAEAHYQTFLQEYPKSRFLPILKSQYEHTQRVLRIPSREAGGATGN